MAHELAGALQQAGRIGQRCAVKGPHVYVRGEYIDVPEGCISQTGDRAAVMQELPDFVPAFSQRLKPLMRDGSQFTGMLFHPRIDGGILLDSAVESQQFRSHHLSTFSAPSPSACRHTSTIAASKVIAPFPRHLPPGFRAFRVPVALTGKPGISVFGGTATLGCALFLL